MKENVATKQEKNQPFKSIRVKDLTKQRVTQFLEKINETEDAGKVSFDELINYFLKNVTNSINVFTIP